LLHNEIEDTKDPAGGSTGKPGAGGALDMVMGLVGEKAEIVKLRSPVSNLGVHIRL
jgi:hypothetical protein